MGGGGSILHPEEREIPLVASCNKNGIRSLRVDYVVFTYDETVKKFFFLRTFRLELFPTLHANFDKLVKFVIFLSICQRDDVIRALDQARGISFNARTKRLSYSSHNSPYTQGKEIHNSY